MVRETRTQNALPACRCYIAIYDLKKWHMHAETHACIATMHETLEMFQTLATLSMCVYTTQKYTIKSTVFIFLHVHACGALTTSELKLVILCSFVPSYTSVTIPPFLMHADMTLSSLLGVCFCFNMTFCCFW